MKTKKISKKLTFSKTTIINLDHKEKSYLRGGYYKTEYFGTCATWHPICFSQPDPGCPTIVEFTDYC
jgi:hypothetical protein